MAVPVSPKALALLLFCGAILPFAAFFAARPDEHGKWRLSNIFGFIVGVIAISVVGFVLYQYR